MEIIMGIKAKLATFGILGLPVAILWFFGGIIGAVIAVAHDDALNAVLSLIIPAYGAIYTIVSMFN